MDEVISVNSFNLTKSIDLFAFPILLFLIEIINGLLKGNLSNLLFIGFIKVFL
ncbi:MAG: hypothetical protein BWX53_00451 [Parcubacteria group bacterium ADurb.Bin016]|nr:MAG: hypothetical protein BWX53_00451 [Parcubacteria group bacterium ADurb.Bin016]